MEAISRKERILSGEELEPISREEHFLKNIIDNTPSYHSFRFSDYATAYNTLNTIFSKNPNAIIKVTSSPSITGNGTIHTIASDEINNSVANISNFTFWSAGVECYLTLKAHYIDYCMMFSYTYNSSVYEWQLYKDSMEIMGKRIRATSDGTDITHAGMHTADTNILHQITFSIYTNKNSLPALMTNPIIYPCENSYSSSFYDGDEAAGDGTMLYNLCINNDYALGLEDIESGTISVVLEINGTEQNEVKFIRKKPVRATASFTYTTQESDPLHFFTASIYDNSSVQSNGYHYSNAGKSCVTIMSDFEINSLRIVSIKQNGVELL